MQLQYRSIGPLKGVDTQTESTKAQPGTLRRAVGCIPYPAGALSAGPVWSEIGSDYNLASALDTAIGTPSDATWAYRLTLSSGGDSCHFVVFYNPSQGVFRGFSSAHYTGASFQTASQSLTQLATSLDSDAHWYASQVGNYVIFGNGVDSNYLSPRSGGLGFTAMSVGTPAGFNDKAKENFPPCTCFALTADRRILAAGNPTNPLRVWVGARANAQHGLLLGVESLDTSYIDIYRNGATRITAISAFNDYYTIHTDAGAVDLFGWENTSDGWKCEQRPSAANAGAPHPNCVQDIDGYASFYLGDDGEIYYDHAVRTGPPNKAYGKHIDCATAMATGQWNRDMHREALKSAASSTPFNLFYDRDRSLIYVLGVIPPQSVSSAEPAHAGLWCFNEKTKMVSGPVLSPQIRYADVTDSIDGAPRHIVGIDTNGCLLSAALDSIEDLTSATIPAMDASLGSDYDSKGTAYSGSTGQTWVALNSARTQFAQNTGGGADTNQLNLLNFSELQVLDGAGRVTTGQFLYNATVIALETPWLNLVDGVRRGVLKAIRLTFDRQPHLYAYVRVRSDDGFEQDNQRGLLYPEAQAVLPTNVGGRRVQLRIVLIGFRDKPWVLRDIEIGAIPARAVGR